MMRAKGKRRWSCALIAGLAGVALVAALIVLARGHPLLEQAQRFTGNDDTHICPDSGVWLPDNRRWLTLTTDGIPGGIGSQPIPLVLKLKSTDVPDQSPLAIAVQAPLRSLLGVTPDYHLIASNYEAIPIPKSVDIYEIGLYPNPPTERKFTVRLPAQMELQEMALSPQGDRVAWTFFISQQPALARMLERFAPTLARKFAPIRGKSVWVSQVNGREMHELGYQPIDTRLSTPPAITDVHWAPDGKHLLFRYDSTTYLLPIE